jgi:cytidylate kinase
MKKIIIAIDGPAGSGKSSSAKIVAERLGYIYIDTGAMYRAITLEALRRGIADNEDEIYKILDELKIELHPSPNGQRTILNGEDVSDAIRLPEVTRWVSPVSAMKCVREKLVAEQRQIGQNGGVVMDGRDIGTVVFPNAELKIYLVASIEARSERRAKELREKNIEVDLEELKKQIVDRDIYDSTRPISPLRKADDAIEIDTSNMTLQEQSELIIELAKKIINS